MSSRAQVSVVIPAYNAEATVGAAVESALAQSLPPAEVIVVDDGSTDDTARVLASFGDHIRVVRQENQGLAGARTTGHAVARGEFIAWLDADDMALPFRLEVQAALLAAEPTVVVVASDFDALDRSGATIPRFARSYHGSISGHGALERIFGARKDLEVGDQRWAFYSGDARRSLIFGNFLHPPTVMMRRTAVERAGALNASFPISEDWLYFVELSALGHVAFIDEPLIVYRQSEGQMSQKATTVMKNNLRALEFVLARNPEIAAAEPQAARRALGHRHRSLAAQLADEERGAAFRHLLWAVRYDPTAPSLLKAAAKVATPGFLLRAYRRRR